MYKFLSLNELPSIKCDVLGRGGSLNDPPKLKFSTVFYLESKIGCSKPFLSQEGGPTAQ